MNAPAPIPCAHCGTNFMRHSIDPEAPKLCNNCIVREKQRPKLKGEDMSKAKILIEVDKQTQVDVEEYCMNAGISLSAYFNNLHKEFQKSVGNPIEPSQTFEAQFQKAAQTGDPLGKKGKKK
jgi:hypothetical protein